MTNKEYYNLSDEFVDAVKNFIGKRGNTLVDITNPIEGFWNFCRETKCQECPFAKSNEECFIQWLNTEVEK